MIRAMASNPIGISAVSTRRTNPHVTTEGLASHTIPKTAGTLCKACKRFAHAS